MSECGTFDATHRIVAFEDADVAACKRALVSQLCERATELRVVVHPTERDGVPDAVTELEAVDSERAVFANDETERTETGRPETERRGSLPDANHVVDAALAAMDDDGSLPIISLCFRGADFDAVVTSSASHSHVGRLDCSDLGVVDALSDAIAEIGVVVPVGPVAGWEQNEKYLELDGAEFCVYAERPADFEDRAYTTCTCHDLARVTGMRADSTTGRIELAWRETDSLFGRGSEFVFGSPPTELRVPDEKFETVEAYLHQFVCNRGSASTE